MAFIHDHVPFRNYALNKDIEYTPINKNNIIPNFIINFAF